MQCEICKVPGVRILGHRCHMYTYMGPTQEMGDTACNVVSICVVCTICDALYCVVGFELVECMQEMGGIPEEW